MKTLPESALLNAGFLRAVCREDVDPKCPKCSVPMESGKDECPGCPYSGPPVLTCSRCGEALSDSDAETGKERDCQSALAYSKGERLPAFAPADGIWTFHANPNGEVVATSLEALRGQLATGALKGSTLVSGPNHDNYTIAQECTDLRDVCTMSGERARAVEEQLEAERRSVEEQARISREERERVELERIDRERIEADRLERERVERERGDIERTEPERRPRTRLSSALFAGIKIAFVVFAIQWLYSHIPGWWGKGKETVSGLISVESKPTTQQPQVPTESAKDSQQIVITPFGKVSIGSDHSLLLNDTKIKPAISGDFGLILDTPIPFGDKYAILITALSGGTACPAMYRWLIVAKSDYVVSKEFGTCSDLAQPSMRGGKLTVTMPGNGGDEVQYSFDGNALTEKHSVQVTATQQSVANAELSSEFSKCMSDAGGITMEVMECLNQETSVQEQRMNRALEQLETKLNRGERAELTNSQSAWKELADRQCTSAADVGGTTKVVGEADCTLKQMSRRAKDIESRLQNQLESRIEASKASGEAPSNAVVPKLVLLNFPVDAATKIVAQMLTATVRGDEKAYISAHGSLRTLEAPVRGDRKAARISNSAALEAIRRGDNVLATKLLLTATEADPADPEIVGNLAYAMHKLNRLEEARSAAIASIFLSPERTAGWGELATILADQGYRDSAVAAFQVELKVSKNQEKMREALQAIALDETQSAAVRNAITQMLIK